MLKSPWEDSNSMNVCRMIINFNENVHNARVLMLTHIYAISLFLSALSLSLVFPFDTEPLALTFSHTLEHNQPTKPTKTNKQTYHNTYHKQPKRPHSYLILNYLAMSAVILSIYYIVFVVVVIRNTYSWKR